MKCRYTSRLVPCIPAPNSGRGVDGPSSLLLIEDSDLVRAVLTLSFLFAIASMIVGGRAVALHKAEQAAAARAVAALELRHQITLAMQAEPAARNGDPEAILQLRRSLPAIDTQFMALAQPTEPPDAGPKERNVLPIAESFRRSLQQQWVQQVEALVPLQTADGVQEPGTALDERRPPTAALGLVLPRGERLNARLMEIHSSETVAAFLQQWTEARQGDPSRWMGFALALGLCALMSAAALLLPRLKAHGP